jgi:hypothetical protein
MVLEAFIGPWTLYQFLNLHTIGRTPWTGDQHVARPLPTHRTTQTQNKRRHPCLEWDSNPRSQCSSRRNQFMPETVRPSWSASPRLVFCNSDICGPRAIGCSETSDMASWLHTQHSRICENIIVIISGSIYSWDFFSPTEQILGSQRILCPMELVLLDHNYDIWSFHGCEDLDCEYCDIYPVGGGRSFLRNISNHM